MSGFIPIHYRPYDDEPAACGAGDVDKWTDVEDDTTCVDCQWAMV